MGHGQGQRQAPLLAGGKLVELGLSFLVQPQPFQKVEAGRHGVVGAKEFHGLVGRDALRQAGRLQLHANQVAQFVGFARGVNAGHAQRAAIRGAQALQALQGAGLARAVGTEQAEYLALSHVKADIVHGDEITVGLGEALHLDYRVLHGLDPPARLHLHSSTERPNGREKLPRSG